MQIGWVPVHITGQIERIEKKRFMKRVDKALFKRRFCNVNTIFKMELK